MSISYFALLARKEDQKPPETADRPSSQAAWVDPAAVRPLFVSGALQLLRVDELPENSGGEGQATT